jgi:hypothetical protein
MAGLDPGLDPDIGYRTGLLTMPISNDSMEMTGSSLVVMGLDRCVRYVNSKGGWKSFTPEGAGRLARSVYNHSYRVPLMVMLTVGSHVYAAVTGGRRGWPACPGHEGKWPERSITKADGISPSSNLSREGSESLHANPKSHRQRLITR